MEEILACRVCLATEVKLFDMFANKLVPAYETVTGVRISSADGLPHKMCSYCSTWLLKSAAFRERCLSSQTLLGYLAETEKITTDVLRHIDRSNHPPTPPFTIECAFSTQSKEEIKEEEVIDYDADIDLDNDIKSEASDEEPLSKKIERRNDDFEVPSVKEEFEGAPEIDLMFLSQEEQVEELKKRMDSRNYMNSLYKCEFCYKGFMTDVTYNNHMARHDPVSGPHRCAVCSTHCASARALRGHVATSHARRYVCKLCDYVTKSGSRAREHSRWHSGHTFVCQLCGASFAKSTSHLTHVRLRHPSGHCCGVCGHSFVGPAGLRLHVQKAHRLEGLGREQCACGAAFHSAAALRTHRLGGCDSTSSPCAVCGESFPSAAARGAHARAAHAAPARCEECDKSFSTARALGVHRARAHLGLRPARARPTPAPRARTLVCELCGKGCHSPASLRLHQRAHSGERPFACAHCTKRFANPQLLQVHTRTHTGERPYKCAQCAKGFVHKAGLNRHARVHTGEKPYACAHCGKAFSQSNSRKLHVNSVHLKLPAPYRARRNLAAAAQ